MYRLVFGLFCLTFWILCGKTLDRNKVVDFWIYFDMECLAPLLRKELLQYVCVQPP